MGEQRNLTEENVKSLKEQLEEMKKNNEVTSRHNTVIRCLTGAIVVLALITLGTNLWTNYNKTGRYAITGAGSKGTLYVLDTKTSRLWIRSAQVNICLGTNEDPMIKTVSLPDNTKDKQEQ